MTHGEACVRVQTTSFGLEAFCMDAWQGVRVALAIKAFSDVF